MRRAVRQPGVEGGKQNDVRRVAGGDLYLKAFHNSPALKSVVRFSDNIILEVNEAFLRTLGYRREEVVGRTPHDLQLWVVPERLSVFRSLLNSEGVVRNFETEVRARDGSIRTVLLSSELVTLDGVPHIMTAGVDISERKAVEIRWREGELRLRESEARFSAAFQASPLLMTIGRLCDEKFVEVNEAFTALLGLRREEVVGKSSQELALWVDATAREAFYRRLKSERRLRNVDCWIRGRDGTVHAVQISGEIIEINQEPHILSFALNVSELRRAEAELQSALAKERELHQLKSDFVSLVSHEFRTPLEIILSSADNLDRYHDRLPSAKRGQLLQTIHKAVRRMSGMMEEVLLLGRLESERLAFKPVPIDVAGFCRKLCDELGAATGGRCRIELKLEGDLDHGFGDETVLRHVFTNLLSNAVKYSEAGQAVEVTVQREGRDAVCQVSDRGCGIPRADQKRLFQAFHRGSNVCQVPGTGLGLLIARRCVDLHGGSIAFESVEGVGTTFRLRLPLFEREGSSHESGAGVVETEDTTSESSI